MILRLRYSQWSRFDAGLRQRTDVETAGVILARRLQDGDVLLGECFLLVPEDGYQIREADRLRIDPVAVNRLIRRARDGGLSVITVHTHPNTDRPWFSWADDAGDSRLMPALFAQMPGPHGSMVVAGNTGVPTGRVWTTPDGQEALEIRWVGQTIVMPNAQADDPEPDDWFDRQRLALGAYGQSILRRLHVGVVGLGGTGSVCFTQLVHLGVGKVTAVDGDRVESSNVSRIVGATKADAGATAKVDVAARYAATLGSPTEVRALTGQLGGTVSPTELESCDIVLSCVDRHTPRAILNRLAYQAAIPVIDMGSAFRVDQTGHVVAGAGRVVIIGPERPCLACWGHVDPHRLRIEALSQQERSAAAAEGYISGVDVAQPSVISFNTAIAGAAITELLRLCTGFGAMTDMPTRFSFDFLNGSVRSNRLSGSRSCRICSQSLHDAAETGLSA